MTLMWRHCDSNDNAIIFFKTTYYPLRVKRSFLFISRSPAVNMGYLIQNIVINCIVTAG